MGSQRRKLTRRQRITKVTWELRGRSQPPGSLWRPPTCAQQGPPRPPRLTKVRAEVRQEPQKSSVWLSGPVQALSPLEACSPPPQPTPVSDVWPGLLCVLSRAAGKVRSGQCQLGFSSFTEDLEVLFPHRTEEKAFRQYMTSCERNMETVGSGTVLR